MDTARVKDIEQYDAKTLKIKWTDDREQFFDVVDLRRKCPCASCIDEWSHEPILKADQVDPNVRPLRVDSVGSYALSIHFTDGHRTGIYTFPFLRSLTTLN